MYSFAYSAAVFTYTLRHKTRAETPQKAFIRLFCFFVLGVLFAERAVFIQSKSVGIVLFILDTVVISVFAFRAFKRDFGSCRLGCHIENSMQKNYTLFEVRNSILTYERGLVNLFSHFFRFF